MAEVPNGQRYAYAINGEIQYTDHFRCLEYPKFFHFGWETLYKKYMLNVIKSLDIHSDISRLFVLIRLDLSYNNLTDALNKMPQSIVLQQPEAKQLTNNLKDMLPDADPIYLDLVGEYYAFDHTALSEFIEQITTKKKVYPKTREYNDGRKTINLINSLTVNFNVEEFLNICPDPVNYFKNRKPNSGASYSQESMSYLSEKFYSTSVNTLRFQLTMSDYNLTDTVVALKNNPDLENLKNKRKIIGNPSLIKHKITENIEFLKEMAFIEHKEHILIYIDNGIINHRIQVEEARSTGSLNTCECCYSDELLTSEVYSCPAGHGFCSACIKKGTEVAVGTNKIDLKCFANCDEEFDIEMIKKIVDEKLYERIMRHKQAQEIKSADIEGLETCAFCDYSVILSPDHKIIYCLNPECKKETCRECREESHLPLRCDQVEKNAEVEVRTLIENKMTEVLIRTCFYCNRKFVKEDGCNKMTCSCGKQMCYICRKPVECNYAHFYHEHVVPDKCPLYTDENLIHTTAVEAAARLILKELNEKKPELLKKIDLEKILPAVKNKKIIPGQVPYSKTSNVNQLLATIIGQDVEGVINLNELRSLEPKYKKTRR